MTLLFFGGAAQNPGGITAQMIRDWSRIDFTSLGFETNPKLQRLVDRAVAFVYAYTGAGWDSGGKFHAGLAGTDPVPLRPLAENAVQLLTEVLAFRAQEDVPETVSDFDIIQSFSAGSYSETRRDPRAASQIGIAQLVVLQSTLWPLMDEYHQDEWIRLTAGQNAPAFAVTAVDWGAGSDNYGYGTGYDYGGHGALPYDPSPPIH